MILVFAAVKFERQGGEFFGRQNGEESGKSLVINIGKIKNEMGSRLVIRQKQKHNKKLLIQL